MTVARLCRGRTLAVVLGANLFFLGLLLAFQGVKDDVDNGQNTVYLSQDANAIYRLPKGSASVIKAKYFQLREGKFCHFMNTETSRSLMYKDCVCAHGFYGSDCGIPHFIWSQLLLNGTAAMTLKRLQEPRRVIEFKFSADPLVQNVTVCNSNASTTANASLEASQREAPDLQVYTGTVQANFTCTSPRLVAYSCSSLFCCWNRFWMLASELSFTDLVVIDIGESSPFPVGSSTLPGDLLEFFKFYHGYPEVLMIRRGPSVSVVASFNSIAVECNFDIKCIASCESSKFQVISLDL